MSSGESLTQRALRENRWSLPERSGPTLLSPCGRQAY